MLDGVDLGWIAGIGVAILLLAVVWTVLRFALKLTLKVFTLGCLGIVLLGLGCAAISYFSGASAPTP